MKLIFFILTLFASVLTFAADRQSCGKSGGISERISDCSEINKGSSSILSNGKFWTLVTVNSKGKEVWRDYTSRLIWSDILDQAPSIYYWAESACLSQDVPDEGKGGLSIQFDLPSIDELRQAQDNGASIVFTDALSTIWTGTMVGDVRARNFTFSTGASNVASIGSKFSIRCVARSY